MDVEKISQKKNILSTRSQRGAATSPFFKEWAHSEGVTTPIIVTTTHAIELFVK